jgi:hypothetical protein
VSIHQQINLYQQAAPQGLTAFTARTSLLTLGIVMAALLCAWAYGRWQLNLLQHNLASISAQRQQQQAFEFSADTANAISTDPTVIATQLAQLQTTAAIRQRSLAVLAAHLHSNAIGFTPRLEALARRHVEGVWLDHILLTNARGVASIGGGTVSVELIPQYLHGLTSELSLTGTLFNEFRIEGRYASDDDSTQSQNTTKGTGYRFSASHTQQPG